MMEQLLLFDCGQGRLGAGTPRRPGNFMYSKIMARSISCTEKKGRGRPRKNPTSIHLTLLPEQLARLDAFIAEQGVELSRAEAVRRVLDEALPRAGLRRMAKPARKSDPEK
jgi:hypothetical protein